MLSYYAHYYYDIDFRTENVLCVKLNRITNYLLPGRVDNIFYPPW